MTLLCECGVVNLTSAPDACVCSSCGRVWLYERDESANGWRCIGEPLTTTNHPDRQNHDYPTTAVRDLRACKTRSMRDFNAIVTAAALIEEQAATILRQRKQLADLNAKKDSK